MSENLPVSRVGSVDSAGGVARSSTVFSVASPQNPRKGRHRNLCEQLWMAFRSQKPSYKPSVVHEAKKEMCFGLLTNDALQQFVIFFLGIFKIYQMLVASLLLLFVPQACYDSAGGKVTCTTIVQMHSNSHLQQAAMVLNWITLGMACLNYLMVWKRENHFIQYLDDSDDVSDDRLPEIFHLYQEIKETIYFVNLRVFVTSSSLMALSLANGAVSGVYLIGSAYQDFQTVTVFATNSLLNLSSIATAMQYSWQGMQKKGLSIPVSIVEQVPKVFNIIDADWVNPRDLTYGGRDMVMDPVTQEPYVPELAGEDVPERDLTKPFQ